MLKCAKSVECLFFVTHLLLICFTQMFASIYNMSTICTVYAWKDQNKKDRYDRILNIRNKFTFEHVSGHTGITP